MVREALTKSGWHFYQLNTESEVWVGLVSFAEPLEKADIQKATNAMIPTEKIRHSRWSFDKTQLVIFIGICVTSLVFWTLVAMKYSEQPEPDKLVIIPEKLRQRFAAKSRSNKH